MLKIIGSKIRKLRENKGWSQEQLAFECKLHRTYIGSVERGERNITILTLIRIAKTLNVSVSEILKDIDKTKST